MQVRIHFENDLSQIKRNLNKKKMKLLLSGWLKAGPRH